MVTRRLFLAGIGFGAAAMPVAAKAATPLFEVDLRGAIDASEHGIRPGADDGKSRATGLLDELAGVIDDAAKSIDERLGQEGHLVDDRGT